MSNLQSSRTLSYLTAEEVSEVVAVYPLRNDLPLLVSCRTSEDEMLPRQSPYQIRKGFSVAPIIFRYLFNDVVPVRSCATMLACLLLRLSYIRRFSGGVPNRCGHMQACLGSALLYVQHGCLSGAGSTPDFLPLISRMLCQLSRSLPQFQYGPDWSLGEGHVIWRLFQSTIQPGARLPLLPSTAWPA